MIKNIFVKIVLFWGAMASFSFAGITKENIGRFDDWKVECTIRDGLKEQSSCAISSSGTISLYPSGNGQLEIAIMRGANHAYLLHLNGMSPETALNIEGSDSVSVSVDKALVKLSPFKGGYTMEFNPTVEALVQEMLTGKEVKISYMRKGDHKSQFVSIPLKGFPKAVEAVKKFQN